MIVTRGLGSNVVVTRGLGARPFAIDILLRMKYRSIANRRRVTSVVEGRNV